MRLVTYRLPDGTQAGRVDGSVVIPLPFRDVGALISSAPHWLEVAQRDDFAPPLPLSAVDLAPTVINPPKVLCLGLNYADHIQESGASHGPEAEYPIIFAKFSDSLTGPRDKIMLPKASQFVDWEAEMVVILGSTVRNASESDAVAAIAGYAVGNDVSMRDWQRRTREMLQGKAWTGSSPVGPMVTADEISTDGRPDLQITCELDGQIMQSSRTRHLIFDAVAIIRYASTFASLGPGDLIFTGTPAGVGFAQTPPCSIQPGQTLRTAIEGLGECVNEFYTEVV